MRRPSALSAVSGAITPKLQTDLDLCTADETDETDGVSHAAA
jgi:hypothetical protein